MQPLLDASSISPRGWNAELELRFEYKNGRTRIARRRHLGPLLVQREFPQSDGSSHVYVIHPPGGVASGDRLEIRATASAHSEALITSPAATKLYRKSNAPATLHQSFVVEPAARLWWLPQETIAYRGTSATLCTQVTLSAGAHYCGWETLCLGEDNAGLTSGNLLQSLHIRREEVDLWEEKLRLDAGSRLLTAPWGLAGMSVCATLVATGADESLVKNLRGTTRGGENADELFGITCCGELLVARYLGHRAERARGQLLSIVQAYAEKTLGRRLPVPRIWAT